MMNWGHDGKHRGAVGIVKPAWGVPTPGYFQERNARHSVHRRRGHAGLELKRLCERGPVKGLVAHSRREWLASGASHGRRLDAPRGSEFVIVGGHQDRDRQAATDNAAGNACIMDSPASSARTGTNCRRGLDLGSEPPRDGHDGRLRVVRRPQLGRLRENAIAYLLIDQPACIGTSRWLTRSNMEMRPPSTEAAGKPLFDASADWKAAPHFHMDRVSQPRRADAGRLIDEEIGDCVLAQAFPLRSTYHAEPAIVPVSWAVQKPNSSPRRNFVSGRAEDAGEFHDARIACRVIGSPPALSTESWWPPTMTNSASARRIEPADREMHRTPAILDVSAQPDLDRPALHKRFQLEPGSARDAYARMPGISFLKVSGVGTPHAGFTDPHGTAVFPSWPQFIITAPSAPFSAAMRCFS